MVMAISFLGVDRWPTSWSVSIVEKQDSERGRGSKEVVWMIILPNCKYSSKSTLGQKSRFYPKIHILKIPIFYKIHISEI